jgi:hypothetical protein
MWMQVEIKLIGCVQVKEGSLDGEQRVEEREKGGKICGGSSKLM